jgi:hypothetical protein
MKRDCSICYGIGWVCENHPDKAFDDELGCICGEGMPCECNDSTPPDTSQVIIIGEETVH